MRETDLALPDHTRAMQAALARAPLRDGWLETPDLPEDYRGPRDIPYVRYGAAGRDRPALATLARIVAAMPDAPACEDAVRALDFRALRAAVGRLAAAIRASGTAGPIGLLLSNTVDYPVAVLACLAAGRVGLLLESAAPPAWNEAILRQVGAGLILAEDAAEGVGFGLPCIGTAAAFASGAAGFPPEEAWLGQDAPAFIICTSGSTGQPKALVHSQRTVLHQVAGLIDEFHLSSRDRFLMATSAATTAGLFTLLTILGGSALHLVALGRGGVPALREALTTRPVTVLRAGPSLMRIVARLPDAAAMLAGLRILRSTGEPLLHADVEVMRGCLPPGCMINNAYGATELSGTGWFVHPGDAQDPVRVAAGILDPGTEAKIVDGHGRPCPPGEVGELWMRSRFAALGEWQEGRLVPGRLEPDPSDPSLRVYRTGDLARLTPDGAFVVLGRMDRMVKVNGMRVELAEVEAALRRSSEVAQAAVVAREAGGRVLLVGFVVPADAAHAGLEGRLREDLVHVLPAHMRPARIIAIGAIPLLPGGKRDEAALCGMIGAA
ncbi:AMP-binding protein [Roseomonas sp. HF4]|uniref:AMP-binding protein n=1 Tax=Roseomonas sp. HF4 TaxID=2562313 RepID=UPI00148558A2|nr:AMP-binding protein [Roseomonas sp. HF4]